MGEGVPAPLPRSQLGPCSSSPFLRRPRALSVAAVPSGSGSVCSPEQEFRPHLLSAAAGANPTAAQGLFVPSELLQSWETSPAHPVPCAHAAPAPTSGSCRAPAGRSRVPWHGLGVGEGGSWSLPSSASHPLLLFPSPQGYRGPPGTRSEEVRQEGSPGVPPALPGARWSGRLGSAELWSSHKAAGRARARPGSLLSSPGRLKNHSLGFPFAPGEAGEPRGSGVRG